MSWLTKARRSSYRSGRILGDLQAVRRPRRIPARIVNRTLGRGLGRLMRKVWR